MENSMYLEYNKNESFNVTLKSMNYETKEREWEGKVSVKYQFELMDMSSKYFSVSKTLLELIELSGVKPGQPFTLELAQVQFDDGMKSFWKLNGKTKKQWGLEGGPATPVAAPNLIKEPQESNIEKRINDLESRIRKLEGDLPF